MQVETPSPHTDVLTTPGGAPALSRRRPDRKSLLRRVALAGRAVLMGSRIWYLRKVVKMDIHPNVRISLKAHLDFTNPRGVHIGEGTLISFHAVILAHDMSRALHTDTYIGRNCFIGAFAMVMPGLRVGDGCIVGSGSVVTKDVPPNSIVAGNPARILKSDIQTREWGVLEEAYQVAAALPEVAA